MKRIILFATSLLVVYGTGLQQASANVPVQSTDQIFQMEHSLRIDYQRFRREISGGDMISRLKGRLIFVYGMRIVAHKTFGDYDLVLATCNIYGQQHIIQAFQRRGDVHWGMIGGTPKYPPCVPAAIRVGGLGFLSKGKRVRLVSGIVLDKQITTIRIENSQHILIRDIPVVNGKYYLDAVELPQQHSSISIEGIDSLGRVVRSTCTSDGIPFS